MEDYREMFLENFHNDKPKQRHIGLEVEFPAVQKEAPHREADIIPIITSYAQEHGWPLLVDDTNPQQIVGFKCDEGRVLTPEFTIHVAEVALPPRPTLEDIQQKDLPWFAKLRQYFSDNGALLLGFGALPNTQIANLIRTKRGRYRTLEDALTKKVRTTGLTASTQVSIEVSKDELITATNVCNALSPLSIALTANSSVWKGKVAEGLAVREGVWDMFAPERAGLPRRPFVDMEDYLKRMFDLNVLIERNGSNYFTPPESTSFRDMVKDSSSFMDAWKLFEGTVWWNARPRAVYGTIEIRPNCTQPHGEETAVAAFWLGIVEALSEAQILVDDLSWEEWRALRPACIRDGLRASVNKKDAHMLSLYALSIAENGLKQRDNGEEIFLEPLWERWDTKRTPAQHTRSVFEREGIEGLVRAVS